MRKSKQQQWCERCPLRKWRLAQSHPDPKAKGWNRAIVARRLGVSPTIVSMWELGNKVPGLESLVKLRRLTAITPEQWLHWINRRPDR